jgi:hypothetical protein
MHNTYNILGTREIAKRIYVMMKTVNPDALILNHMSEEPAMPVMSFVDMMVDGELYCKQVAEDKSYYNAFSPAWFRAEFMSRQWGPSLAFIPQFKRGSKLYNPSTMKFWDTPAAQKPLNHFIGYILVHDTKCWPNFGVSMDKVWAIQDQFGWDDKLKFIPYWDKNSPVTVAQPQSKLIMASTYTRPGKAMIIVLNDTDKDEIIELKLDKARVVPGNPTLTAKDATADKALEIKNSILKVSVPNREFRIIILK